MKFTAGYLLASLLLWFTSASAHEFYFGADLSFANEMDDCGAVYRENGQPKDVYAIFKDHGTNLARIRIWNAGNPTKYSNLADVERSLRRAKTAGMQTQLDFHYSDWWADGGKQIIPAAWADIKDEHRLAQALYQYTYDTLKKLDRAGLMPNEVQVGNEINHEMLQKEAWRYGPIDWQRNALLINAGIKAVRDASAHSTVKPKVMIQIAQPENVPAWFEQAEAAGVTDFDMIGISYYGKWSNYSMVGLGGTINQLRNRYPKVQVMVIETAYPWTLGREKNPANSLAMDNFIPGYPVTPQGQEKYLIDLTQIVIANGGVGVAYWAPDWIASQCRKHPVDGADWPNMTFFDTHNNDEVLPAIDYARHAYDWPVPVAFRFHGAPPSPHLYLWGDFLGPRDYAAVPLEESDGALSFKTTIMPGQTIRFQVFGESMLQTPLLSGSKVSEGTIKQTIPADGAAYDYDLSKPAN